MKKIELKHDSKSLFALAREFSKVLRSWLSINSPINKSKKNLFEIMVIRHIKEKVVREPFCLSHDYCDANMAMEEAWNNLFTTQHIIDSPAHNKIWNEAWNIAKKNNFFYI